MNGTGAQAGATTHISREQCEGDDCCDAYSTPLLGARADFFIHHANQEGQKQSQDEDREHPEIEIENEIGAVKTVVKRPKERDSHGADQIKHDMAHDADAAEDQRGPVRNDGRTLLLRIVPGYCFIELDKKIGEHARENNCSDDGVKDDAMHPKKSAG